MYLFVLLVSVAAASAEVFIEAQCPEPKAVENFDFASFGSGRWYEVAKYENSAERGGECSYCDYVFEGARFKIKNSHVADRKLAFIEGSAKLADDAGTKGILEYSYPYGPNGSISKHRLYVLSTNYKDFAVVYYCNFMPDKNMRQDFSWVFSRRKGFTSDTQFYIGNFLKDTNFLISNAYKWTDFSDSACTYEERVK